MEKGALLEKAATEFRIIKETSGIMAIEPVPYDAKIKELIRIIRKRREIRLENTSSYIGSIEDLKALQPDFMAISELERVPRLFCFKKHDNGTIVKSLVFMNDGTSPFKNEAEQSEVIATDGEVSAYLQNGAIYSTIETTSGEFITYNNK